MKKKLFNLALSLAIVTGLSASAVQAAANIAIVDVPQVVSASPQVQALKKDQQAKAEDLVKLIEKARKEVTEQTDATKKKNIEEKYNKEIKEKQEKIQKDYAEKLKEIDNSISKQITTQAQRQGYDVVLSKNVVLYGGKDITAEIIKVIK